MASALVWTALGAALAGAVAVVATRDPMKQALVAGAYGVLLAVAFVVLDAPDVAIAQLVIGGFASPFITMMALAKARSWELEAEAAEGGGGDEP